MKSYLKIYARLLKMNFNVLLAYRIGFLNSVVGSIGWALFQIISIYLLTSRNTSFYGWSREQLILLGAIFNIFVGIFHAVFSRNFGRFSQIMNRGEFDLLLVKPVDPQFLTSLWWFSYSSLVRILIGAGFVVYLFNIMHMVLTFLSVIKFIVLIGFGICILYAVWLLVCTLIIWQTNLSNLVDFLYTINIVIRYPREMFQTANPVVFYFLLPLTFVIITPTKALLGNMSYVDLFGLIFFAVVFLFISRKFWNFALRFYTSASS